MSGQTDQSRLVSRAFMSRLREVLTARLPQDRGWVVWVDGVVEELAAGCGVEDPRLAQISALCDTEAERYGYVRTEVLRAVLDAVSVDATPARGIDRDALSPRERAWLIDVAQEGVSELLETVRSIESDPVPTDDELSNAVAYGVRADCGQRAIDKVLAGAFVRPVEGESNASS